MKYMRMLTRTLVLAWLAAAVVGRAHAGTSAVTAPDLRGHWRLDAAHSDDPQQKLQEAMANMPAGPMAGGGMPGGGMPGGGMPGGGLPGGGMPGGGGPGGGRPGGAHGDTDDGPGMPGTPPDAKLLAPRFETFTIEQHADTLAFLDHGLRVRQVVLNPSRSLPPLSADGVEQAAGRWKQAKLRVESRGRRNERIVEHWELLNGDRVLRCTTVVSLGLMGSIELNRVYVRATEEPGAAAAPDTQGGRR